MSELHLERIFTLDVRETIYPAYADPYLHQFAVDVEGDSIVVLLGHMLGTFSISRFPDYTHDPFDAVYINSIALGPSSGVLVVGGNNYSGSPPLKVFDIRQKKPLWVVSNLSDEFLERSSAMAARLSQRYGPNIVKSSIQSVKSVGVSDNGHYIAACAIGRSRTSEGKSRQQSTLQKYSLRGELLAELPDMDARCITLHPDGSLLAIASGPEVIVLDANTWSILRSKTVTSSQIAAIAIDGERRILVVASEEGEIVASDSELNPLWSLRIDAIPRCIRFSPELEHFFLGTNLGDLLTLTRSGAVTQHSRVSESIRDVSFLHQGRHVLVGCKNMDIHLFSVGNGDKPASTGELAAWETRLSQTPTSVYTSTASLTGARVFISYSSADRAFVEKLEARLTADGVRCWRDSHSLKAGRITRQLRRAIMRNDVLLVVLSTTALASDWVRWEVDSARTVEKESGRDIICPITIDNAWESWSDDPVLKREILKYHLLAFQDWQDEDTFDDLYSRLISGLRDNYLEPREDGSISPA